MKKKKKLDDFDFIFFIRSILTTPEVYIIGNSVLLTKPLKASNKDNLESLIFAFSKKFS